MTYEKVTDAIDAISLAVDQADHEKAHALKDKLYYDVLLQISRGDSNCPEVALARAALAVEEIVIEEWCA